MVVTPMNDSPAAGVPLCFLVTGVGGNLTARVNGGNVPVTADRTAEGWVVCYVPQTSGFYSLELSSSKRQTGLVRSYVP